MVRRPPRPCPRRPSIAALAVLVAALVATPAAWGHALLVATDPATDAVAEEAPTRVLLRFNEPVEGALGSVRVFDASGDRVDDDRVTKPSAEQIGVGIADDLARGTYTVAWRVISADSDPISGAFVFHVGAPGPQPSGIAAQVLEDTPRITSAVYTAGRFFEFAFLLLCAGGVAALLYALRSADDRVHRRLYGILAGCAGSLVVFALLAIPFQGAAAAASPLADAFSGDVISSVVETRYGKVELVRAGLALGLLVVALALRRARGRGRELGTVAAALLAAGLTLTPSFGGHASVAGTTALVSDIAHVASAAAWVGGLAFVVLALVFALDERWPLATRSVPRFSTMAIVSVIVLLVAGTINSFVQVGAWRGLWETQYGLLLLAKISLIIPLLGLGAYNNRYAVPRLRSGVAQPRERRRFLQTAGVELALMVAIVAVTAVLVNAAPAKDEVMAHGGETTAEVDFGGEATAHVRVEPGTIGTNEIHIEFGAGHEETEAPEFEEVALAATAPGGDIGPIRYEATEAGHAGYVVRNASFGLAGEWQLRIEARRGEFELLTGETTIEINER
jgi:copper transport protein